MTRLAPASASATTTALPIPLLPPVTMATFPCRFMPDSLVGGVGVGALDVVGGWPSDQAAEQGARAGPVREHDQRGVQLEHHRYEKKSLTVLEKNRDRVTYSAHVSPPRPGIGPSNQAWSLSHGMLQNR